MGTRINIPAVIVAAVVHFMFGAVWFTMFMNEWLAGIGKTQEQLKAEGSAGMAYGLAFVANLLIAYTLAWFISKLGMQTLKGGMTVAGLAWLAFTASTIGTNYAFEARSLQIFCINAGYPLVGMLMMGAIIGAWKNGAQKSASASA